MMLPYKFALGIGAILMLGITMSHLDRRYTLEDVLTAIRYLEEGHVRGNIAIYF